MTDKPLEWDDRSHLSISSECDYVALGWGSSLWWMDGHWYPVPGPYDGTIETAKQRCEEHRRKVMEVRA